MSKRRKNLLDAFRASGPSKPAAQQPNLFEPPRAPAARTDSPASAHPSQGPLPARVTPPASSARAPAAATPPPARRPGTHADVAPPAPPISGQRIALLVLLLTTISLCTYLLLRDSRDADVSASNGGAPAATSGAAPATAPFVPPVATPPPSPMLDPKAGYTDFDRAFYDKANRFTVRVAQYPDTPAGEKQARDAYRYLKNEGYRVVQPIRKTDDKALVLCAFAEPKKADVDPLCDQVKKLRGPAGTKYPFASAYVDNIDHVVAR